MKSKALAACFLTLAAVHAATVSIDPVSQTVGVGNTVDVNVDITDVSDLYAFQFDVGFDPTLLAATSESEGPFLSSAGTTIFLPGTIDNIGGAISGTADVLSGAISGASTSGTPGVLATLQFTSLAEGTSAISLSNIVLLDSSLNDISFTSIDGSATVVPVGAIPEPRLILVLFAGFLAIAAFQARRRRIARQ
ncbi:MAG TPA: cohesin domain-containing protein [Bryobacteraceae bacterium]|nr:cohesin domain-containing protein [Bryobacteraceae bacterium]